MKITRRQLRKLILRETRNIMERRGFPDIDDMLDDEKKYPNNKKEAIKIVKDLKSGKIHKEHKADYGLWKQEKNKWIFKKKDTESDTITVTSKDLK